MKTINSYIIVDVNKPLVSGVLDDGNLFYTDPLLAILDNYLVTEREIYKLGSPDPVWIATESGWEIFERYQR